MTKGKSMDEVSVLKFFETGPIEKAEAVFNIVAEKMRERRCGGADGAEAVPRAPGRRRHAKTGAEPGQQESQSSAV